MVSGTCLLNLEN